MHLNHSESKVCKSFVITEESLTEIIFNPKLCAKVSLVTKLMIKKAMIESDLNGRMIKSNP
jgi:hypothetical protein